MNGFADIGLTGLAVMGENLLLNMESKGFHVAVYNRTTDKVTQFIQGRGRGKKTEVVIHLKNWLLRYDHPAR